MKNKRVIGVSVILVITAIIISIISVIIYKETSSDKIPEGYIAVFHGGVGERTYETYIYKIDNGRVDYGFDYINTTSTTKSYGSSEWRTKIAKRGSVDWIDDIFSVAKENYADSYVTCPNGDKDYYLAIQFKKCFL